MRPAPSKFRTTRISVMAGRLPGLPLVLAHLDAARDEGCPPADLQALDKNNIETNLLTQGRAACASTTRTSISATRC
jgi:hypothetical protein